MIKNFSQDLQLQDTRRLESKQTSSTNI